MDTIPSTEFRRRFPKLTARTIVTVNGHPIGTWDPSPIYHADVGEPERRRVDVDSGQSRRIEDQEKIQALSGPPTLAETRRMRAAAAKAFGQFRPAPKPGKR